MNFKAVIDTLVRDSGDPGADYKANAYRWLTFVRVEAANEAYFPTGRDVLGTITTSSGNTAGIYAITGFSRIVGTDIYDTTSDNVIYGDTEAELLRRDPNRDEFSQPTLWADAGTDEAGTRRVRFWPIPNAEYVLQFVGDKIVGEITAEQETLQVDPYFGPITNCAPMLLAGLRWQDTINDNQDIANIAKARATFDRAIKSLAGKSTTASQASSRLDPVNLRSSGRGRGGRFSSHFDNR